MLTPYFENTHATLYHGDALDILAQLEPGTVDAVITDPPYSSGGFTRGDRAMDPFRKYFKESEGVGRDLLTFAGDTRSQRGFEKWTTEWAGRALRAAKTGAHIKVFTDWRQLPSTYDALEVAGWRIAGIVVWDKGNGRPNKNMHTAQAEYVIYGFNGPNCLNQGKPKFGRGVLSYPAPAPRKRTHPTEKALPAMRDLCAILPDNSVILDPFTGSGTTGAAALAEGHRFIGIEISEHYAKATRHRLTQALATLATS